MRYEALPLGWGYHAWALGSIRLGFLWPIQMCCVWIPKPLRLNILLFSLNRCVLSINILLGLMVLILGDIGQAILQMRMIVMLKFVIIVVHMIATNLLCMMPNTM